MSSPVGYPQRNAYPMFSSTSQGGVPVGENGANLIPVTASTSAQGVVINPIRYGYVTARAGWNPYWHTTNKQCNSRSFDYARDNLTSIKLGFQNAYVAVTAVGAADGKEYGFGTATIRAQVEYPVGSGYTDVTFGGSLIGTIPSGGLLESDEIAVNIPRGAKFYYRIMYRNIDGTGMLYTKNGVTGDDVSHFSTSGLGDIMSGAGTITQTQAGSYYGPAYVVQKTRVRSFALLGDSRMQGYSDIPEAVGYSGQLGRALSPHFGVCRIAQYSDRLSWFLPYGAVRQGVLKYATDIWTNHGINDLNAGGLSVAVHEANILSLAQIAGSRGLIAMTLPPLTTSTDSWATTGNQTISNGTVNAKRIAYNNDLRGGLVPGVSCYIEAADAVESARDSGIWKAPGYVADGTHETALGNAAISAAVPMWLAVKDAVI